METMMSWGNKDNDVWTKTFRREKEETELLEEFLASALVLFQFRRSSLRAYNFTLQRFSPTKRCNFFRFLLVFLRLAFGRLRGALYIIFFIIIFFCTLFVVIISGRKNRWNESPKEWWRQDDRKQLRQKAPRWAKTSFFFLLYPRRQCGKHIWFLSSNESFSFCLR